VVEFPVFPGYVFVRSPLERIGEVGRADRAAAVVRFNGRPAPIADHEISNMRRLARALARSEETELLAATAVERGQPVQVESGPLAGVKGLVLEKRGKGRALIQIGIGAIGLAVTAEVEAADLRRLGRAVES
jgi:transcription antitermination factor NusG